MSLTRALTKRIGNRERDNSTSSTNSENSSGFSLKLKRNSMGIKKGLISSPVELISTTNSLVHTAPSVQSAQNNVRISTSLDIPPSPTSSSTPPPLTPDNGHSDHDLPSPPTTPTSDRSSGHSRSGSTSSGDKQMFSTSRSNSALGHRRTTSSTSGSLQRSSSSAAPATAAPTVPPRMTRTPSNGSSRPNVPGKNGAAGGHPFGKELAQVSELAEEMGLDLDEECMVQRGLHKFSVQDYLQEVESVIVVKGLFGRKPSVTVGGDGWI